MTALALTLRERGARLVGVLLACLLAAQALAGAPPRSLRFDQLNVEQGLAQESVLSIMQDRQGFMWFGSQAGLSRYDGYRVSTYRHRASDPHSLAGNEVRAMYVDGAGRLWIGTDNGLDRYESASMRFVHFVPDDASKRGNGNRRVRAIVGDGKDGLWLATGDGLQHFDTRSGRFTLYHHDPTDSNSLIDNRINALARDADGRLWIATSSGLDSLDSTRQSFVHHTLDAAPESKYNVPEVLLVDAEQSLWIGSLGGLEVWTIKGGLRERRRMGPVQGLASGPIKALFQDADASVWVGSYADGLFRWQGGQNRFLQYQHQGSDPHSLADNQVASLYRDRTGTFWVGTWYAGASRVDLSSGGFARIVNQPERADSLPDNRVRAMIEDGRGQLWLGTNRGLSHYDPASGTAVNYRALARSASTLNDPAVGALAHDVQGRLWVGGRAGLNGFDPARGRYTGRGFSTGDPDGDDVRGVLVDRAGIVWAASRGGLHRYDPGTNARVTYRHDPQDSTSLADNAVRPMLEDRHGRFWVGTFNGLDLLDRASGKFHHFRSDPKDPFSLSHNEVHYLFEDKNGTIWVGTAAGLNRLDSQVGRGRFTRFTALDGLLDDSVSAILEDEARQLWVSTNSGIAKFNPTSGKFRNYGAAEGIVEGAYFDGSALHGADGTMYFGGFNGITAFAPGAIRDNLSAPHAVITDFLILNESVRRTRPELLNGALEHAGSITLEARDAVFSLEFAALHFAAPQRNHFTYQLQGFDENWVITDASKRFATYTNLDPGKYVFRVRAANKDGIWNDSGAELEIVVRPPYWKSWWFRAGAFLVAVGAAAILVRARMAELRRQRLRLEQLVRARTEEIAEQNRLLERQKEELEMRRLDTELRRLDAERQKKEVERQKDNVELAHRNISVLSEIGREMTSTLNLEKIMGTVYRHVHHLMEASIFGIGFYREEQRVIEFPYTIERGLRMETYSRSINEPNQFAVWCVLNRRDVFINDVTSDAAKYINVEQALPAHTVRLQDGTAPQVPMSMMYTPMIVKDRVMGVLCVQSVEKHAYERVHLDMLQTLAVHAAVALDNARAYQQLEIAQARLLEQEKQVRLQSDELALANHALQENDERLRLAKQKAEDATRQKSEFLANMSHEMRTPLAGVIGMLGFALRDTLLRPSTHEQIARAQTNAESLLTIINDLLDFSKIEAGKLTIENIDFDLRATIDNVFALFEDQAAERSIAFCLDIGADLPPFVVGDPTRLRQVMVNLVGNAFKFTRAGLVTVHVERADGPAARAGEANLIRFSVTDTGIGIPAHALARLFQKFEQADSTTTRRYGGSGLGLAICRQLVDLMGGDIHVESAEGKGSRFAFVLPLPDGIAQPQLPPITCAPHTHRLNVLCAEDFPTNQIIIRMMLEEMGHHVEIAENGLLAVAACAHTRYDLILMDGRMPEMDGATATRMIRVGGPQHAPVQDSELMIVALTANASEEDRSRYLGAGMDDFLTKPINETALHVQVSRAIERQLKRGVVLDLMPSRAPDGRPGSSELDAMFGVSSSPAGSGAPDPVSPVLRANGLKERMRVAFSADIPGRLIELKVAIGGGDRDAAGRVLHGLKGSAAYLDATELSTLCGQLELAADQGEWASIDTALPLLYRLLDQFDTVAQ